MHLAPWEIEAARPSTDPTCMASGGQIKTVGMGDWERSEIVNTMSISEAKQGRSHIVLDRSRWWSWDASDARLSTAGVSGAE